MEIFFQESRAGTITTNPQASGPSVTESPRAQERKPVDPPDGQGTRRSLPPSRCPHQAAALDSTEIPNRAPGNNSTLDDFFLPRSLGAILKSDRAVHNPATPLECLRKAPGCPQTPS